MGVQETDSPIGPPNLPFLIPHVLARRVAPTRSRCSSQSTLKGAPARGHVVGERYRRPGIDGWKRGIGHVKRLAPAQRKPPVVLGSENRVVGEHAEGVDGVLMQLFKDSDRPSEALPLVLGSRQCRS